MKQIPYHLRHLPSVLKILVFLPLHIIYNKERHVILQRVLPLMEFLKHLKEITIILRILPG